MYLYSFFKTSFLCIFLSFFARIEKVSGYTTDFHKDSTQILTLLKSARQSILKDFPKAISEAQNALALAQKLNDNRILFVVYRETADIYENNSHLKEAYTYYKRALALQNVIPVSKKLDIYLDWAIINKKIFNYIVARDYYNMTIDLAHKAQDLEMVQYAYSGLGALNVSLSEYDVAIDCHLHANEIAEKRKDTEGSVSIQLNIATVQIQTQNYDLAYQTLKKAHNLALKIKDSLRIGCILNGYGKLFSAEKKYATTITYHQNALMFFNKTANKRMIAETLGFLADAYTQAMQYDDAEKTFEQCFEYKDYFEFYEHPNLYVKVGNLYLKTQKQEQAMDMFRQSLQLATKRGFKDIIQKSNLGLSQAYEQIGDYKTSLNYIKIAQSYQDSLNSDDRIRRRAEAEYKYNLEKAETEYKLNIAEREREIQVLQLNQNRITLVLLLVVLVLVIAFSFYNLKQKAKNNLILSQKNIEIEFKNDRLEKSNEILQQFAYASAHDLKEPLRSISGFVSIINRKYTKLLPPEASDYMQFVVVGVKRMENLIGALLEYSTIASEVENIEHATPFIDILEEVKNNLYGIILQKNARIETMGYLPALKISRLHLIQLFQNLISNAVKFSDKKPLVQITGKVKNGQYIIEIKDNGIGMKQEYSDKIFRLFQRLSRAPQYEGTGIGLAICKQIVDKYKGAIRFESIENEGTSFYVSFPIQLIEVPQTVKSMELVEN